ncbi:MAG: polysaccharide biosynthesis/export family protein [Pirellulaceae bacterium]|nr:polysaccharide biosynthesis/export family protein [Pirellulaceae bacterium]
MKTTCTTDRNSSRRQAGSAGLLLALISCVTAGGCVALPTDNLGMQTHELNAHPDLAPIMNGATLDENGNLVEGPPPATSPPSELAKVSLPRYRVAPPDILVIQAIRLFPRNPYYIQSSDFLQIIVPNALFDQPIASTFQVDSGGRVNLGAAYDSVKIAGLTLEEGQDAIARHLSRLIDQPQVSVSLLQASGVQQIAGEHLIGPDGFINLGIYGSVYVSGLTVDEARLAIETKLSEYLDHPKVSVDVLIYNSKFFYVITEGAGFGDNVVRIPVTGNETVLDAIAQIGGLQQVSSKRLWISRPSPKDNGCDQILPVDWQAITRGAATGTNYQILPGDRIFVAEDKLIAVNSLVTKVLNPVERMMGFTLLGAQTIQFLQRFPRGSFTF